MDGINTYKKLSRPPAEALKRINGGRLTGKSNIDPQWRYHIMTEIFGLCGIGWKYTIDRLWTEPGTGDNIFAWAQISLYVKDGDVWSNAIPGVGGNFLVEKESAGFHNNDEAYKMSITDALGTAMRMIGVAADVYSGSWDGSKYNDKYGDSEIASPSSRGTTGMEHKKETEPPPPPELDAARTLVDKIGNSCKDSGLFSGFEIDKMRSAKRKFWNDLIPLQTLARNWENILIKKRDTFGNISPDK